MLKTHISPYNCQDLEKPTITWSTWRYKPIVKRLKPTRITIQQWDDDALEQLRGALDCTDWDVFVNNSGKLDELTQTVSDYINFCVEVTVPTKQIKVFPNNKPWITKRVKDVINKKKGLFGKRDQEGLKRVQKELKRVIQEEKLLTGKKLNVTLLATI